MTKAEETKEEKEWEAESDARTLMIAEIIKKDDARLKKARKKAKEMAKELDEEAESMNEISTLSYPSMDTKEKK